MKSALILYPNQLFEFDHLPAVDTVVMVEEPLFFGVDQEYPARFHKQKMILHRASMRRYAEEVLWPQEIDVEYIELDVFMQTGDVLDKVKKAEHIYVFDPVDERIAKRLLQARRERPDAPSIEFLPSPSFYLKDQEIRQYLSERHLDTALEFYQWQRERFNVLIGEDYKPVGGAWTFESNKQSKVAANTALPSFAAFGANKWVEEATKYVEEHFPNNEGSTDFIWPTSRSEALDWAKDFVQHRLPQFGSSQRALDGHAAWLFHSALSSSLNIGLLLPNEVVQMAVEAKLSDDALPNVEQFVRRILGDREMTRGIYVARNEGMRSANPLAHKRRLTAAWHTGSLGIPPYDDVIQKLNQHAYAHNAERQNIIGGLMILAEISPVEIHRFFLEKFIDSYEWASIPHVHALGIFVDPNRSQADLSPCIVSAEAIMQMSSYQKGVWADVWDGLYWRFIEKHRTALSKNSHLKSVVKQLDKVDPDRRRIIQYRADDFLNQFTQ